MFFEKPKAEFVKIDLTESIATSCVAGSSSGGGDGCSGDAQQTKCTEGMQPLTN